MENNVMKLNILYINQSHITLIYLIVLLETTKTPYHINDRVPYNFFAVIQYSLTKVKPLKNVEISIIS